VLILACLDWRSHVLREEWQALQAPVVRGLVCSAVVETGMWFWFEASALFRPLGLFIQMMWILEKLIK